MAYRKSTDKPPAIIIFHHQSTCLPTGRRMVKDDFYLDFQSTICNCICTLPQSIILGCVTLKMGQISPINVCIALPLDISHVSAMSKPPRNAFNSKLKSYAITGTISIGVAIKKSAVD